MPDTFNMAFIQERGNGCLNQEGQLVYDYCSQAGLPIELYTAKRISRRSLPLSKSSFVYGDHDCMRGAMHQLGIQVPELDDYPESLHAYLHRRVWKDTLGGLREKLQNGAPPVFAKPAGRAKVFTGRVFLDERETWSIGRISTQEPVWCSQIVRWMSEYRVYVSRGEIASIDHYAGDRSVALDVQVIEAAISDWSKAQTAPAGYEIDFGVLSSGETALIEANDGYALGAYNIESAPYTELLFARWRDLLALAKE